jgi:hypothetical protein
MINLFLNLISSTWVAPILYNILILFDAVIYALADESYKIFNFAATAFNLSNTSDILSAIIKRIMTLVAVFMFFRILMILIQYIIEPDKLNDKSTGGGKIVTNVVIVIVMLTLLYSGWLFGVIHDVQTLLFGDAKNSYEVIDDWIDINGKNENVIRNLIFGVSDTEFDNFGRELASNMLSSFLYLKSDNEGKPIETYWKDYPPDGGNKLLFYNIANGGKSFFSLFLETDLSDVNLVYIPVVSAIGGLYMIYMFFKYAIQIIVRSLKLFVMELLAPIAIVSYIDPGKGKNMFNNYFKTYFSIYLELFIKLAMIYLSVIFIKFGVNTVIEGDFVNNPGFLTTGIIYILSIIAVFRFMDAAPKLISDVLGIKIDVDKKGGFGKMLGAVAGTAIGTGIGIGSAARAGVGFGAGAFQALSGGIQGGMSGGHSKNFGDFTKGISTTGGKIATRSYKIDTMGGFGNYVSGAVGSALGGNRYDDHQISKIDKQIEGVDKQISSLDEKSGIYSRGDQLRQNLESEINNEYAKQHGSLEDILKNDSTLQKRLELSSDPLNDDNVIRRRDELTKQYMEDREAFTDRVLRGQDATESISYAQKEYNEHVESNSNLEGYSYNTSVGGTAIKVNDSAALKDAKKFSRNASSEVARRKETATLTKKSYEIDKKEIQKTQQYKNRKNFGGSSGGGTK